MVEHVIGNDGVGCPIHPSSTIFLYLAMSDNHPTQEEHYEVEIRTKLFASKIAENIDIYKKSTYEIEQIDNQLLKILEQGIIFTNQTFKFEKSIKLNWGRKREENHKIEFEYELSPADVEGGGNTLLVYVVKNGYIKTAQKLIEMGADLEARDKDGDTPVFYAVGSERIDMVELFIKNNADIHTVNNKKETTLIHAVKTGNLEMTAFLIANKVDVNAKDEDGKTALMYAAKHGDVEAMKLLIANNANVNDSDKYGKTALMYAAEYGNAKAVKLLIDNQADVNAQDNYRKTVLMYAASEKNTASTAKTGAVTKVLLANNADVTIKDEYDQTALVYAINNGNIAAMKALIDAKVAVNLKDRYDKTPLIHAVEKLNVVAIELLLQNGADIDARDKDGKTILMHEMINYGGFPNETKEAVIKILLKYGADIEARDNKGKTAAMHDSYAGIIISLGGNANVEDYEGNKIRHNREALDKGREFYNNFAAGDKILSNRVQIYQALAFTPLVSDSRQKVHYIDNLTKIILSKKWKNYAEITEDFIKGILESMRDNDGTVTDSIIENIIWNFRKQKQFETQNSRQRDNNDRER